MLSERIIIEHRTTADDNYGGVSNGYESLGTVWARVLHKNDSPLWRTMQTQQTIDYIITIRYNLFIAANLAVNDRITWKSSPYRYLEVMSFSENGKRKFIEITTREITV